MEADILDAFVIDDRPYSGAMETVIQSALDDQLGVGVVSLYTPVSPSFRSDGSGHPRRLRDRRPAVLGRDGDGHPVGLGRPTRGRGGVPLHPGLSVVPI